MRAWASERISAARTGWVIALLMAGWALFLLLPFGRDDTKAAPTVAVERPGEAELAAAGLHYNVDWIGLPQFFAIWADRLEWRRDETEFAYWNPGTQSYSYVIRATRLGNGHYRFRHVYTEPAPGPSAEPLAESETHPFVFRAADAFATSPSAHFRPEPAPVLPTIDAPRANVDLQPARFEPPKNLEHDDSRNGKKP